MLGVLNTSDRHQHNRRSGDLRQQAGQQNLALDSSSCTVLKSTGKWSVLESSPLGTVDCRDYVPYSNRDSLLSAVQYGIKGRRPENTVARGAK